MSEMDPVCATEGAESLVVIEVEVRAVMASGDPLAETVAAEAKSDPVIVTVTAPAPTRIDAGSTD